MIRADYGEGGRIVRLGPDGRLRVLSDGFSSAAEFDVSFDAQRILCAAKRDPRDSWNIWEMGADGSGARRITEHLGNCRSPAYQATLYTIVSTEPWYQIMFVSDEAATVNEYGSGLARSLYSCKLDGSAVRRLTMNLSDDLDPFLMDDGRVLLASWQRMDLRRGRAGRIALFGVNTDGADFALFSGDQGRRVKHMPCVTTEGLAVFVEADRVGWDGAGQLGATSLRRNFYAHRSLTDDPALLYHSPSPLRDGSLLVSCCPAEGGGTHGIFRFDPRTGRQELLFDDPEFHDIHAKALVPRAEPDGRSSVVDENYSTGKLYCLNVHVADPEVMVHLEPGTIRSLRVLEGVPLAAPARQGQRGGVPPRGTPGPDWRLHGHTPVVQKRFLGQIPVEEDGSFHIELPADVAIQLQALDDDGMALRSCGWIWVKHREPRGCVGCHEDPELTPENRLVQALQRPAMQLNLPAAKRRTVDFQRDVMPIISRKCGSCHNGGSEGLDLGDSRSDTFNTAYHSLLTGLGEPPHHNGRPDSAPLEGKYVQPGRARTSPLAWRLFGRNTSRPWDETYRPGQTLPTCPPPGAEQLTDGERLTFVEWIDLGAHWDGIPEVDDLSRQAGDDAESGSAK